MNKYKVKIHHVFSEVLDIEADSEDHARELASIELQKPEYKSGASYETTIPVDQWPVITEEKYNEMVETIKEELAKQEEANKEPSNIITP